MLKQIKEENLEDQPQLNLIELFASVQGESSLTGLPTTFVRLAACNLRCSWCDTSYSFGRGTPYSFKTMIDQIDRFSCRHVCMTGGEPLLQQPIYQFMRILCDKGYVVSLETGGSLCTAQVDPRVCTILDIKCPGSEMSGKNYWKNLQQLRSHDEVKFVLLNRKDYDYAKDICLQYHLFERPLPVLLSPVHGVLDPKELISWVLIDKLPIRLNLQLHKFIWPPETKGV